jgi:hypothetical protein
MKTPNRYRITVERLPSEAEADTPAALTFEAATHDEILGIVRKTQQLEGFDADAAAAFAVGLKLFGEALLHRREEQPFADFFPQFVAFMQQIKAHIKAGT